MGRTSLFLLALAVTGCSSPSAADTPATKPAAAAEPVAPTDPGLPDRDPQLAHRLVEQEGALLLDVRTPEEFEAGHLPGAHNINHTDVGDRLEEIESLLEGDRKRPIVVYCRSGRRSGIAKETLVKHGFSQVTNLGGINAW